MYFSDYLVIVGVLVISALIGVYYRVTGTKQATLNEYLFANHGMSTMTVTLSTITSFVTAISLNGVASEVYTRGYTILLTNLGYGLGTPIAAFLILPVFYKLNVTNVYDYLGMRFGKYTKYLASVIYVVQMLLYNSAILYVPSLVLTTTVGIPIYVSMIGLGAICTFYSTIGGIKAVLITDVFQLLIIVLGIMGVIVYGVVYTGSVKGVYDILKSGGRATLFDFTLDLTTRHTIWNTVLGSGLIYLSLYAVSSSQVQKCLTTRNLKSAQYSLIIQWPFLFLLSFLFTCCGAAVYSRYYQCDPVLDKKIASHDGILAYFVIDNLSKYYFLSGLFVAALISASLSTMSALMNNLGMIIYRDFWQKIVQSMFKKELSPKQESIVVQIFVLLFGIVCTALSFVIARYSSILTLMLTIFACIGGPMVALFSLGMFTIAANDIGSSIGFICGLTVNIYMGLIQPKSVPTLAFTSAGCSLNSTMDLEDFMYEIRNGTMSRTDTGFDLSKVSYMWLGPIGFLLTFVVGYATSQLLAKLWPQTHLKTQNPDLYSPPVAYFLKRKQSVCSSDTFDEIELR